MSRLILPEGFNKKPLTKKEEKKDKEEGPALERIPQATGWRMIVLPYRGTEKTKGGLYLTDKAVEEQQLTTNVGIILSIG